MAASDNAAAQLDLKFAQSLAHLSTAHSGRQLALAQHHGKRYQSQVEASKARPALEGEIQSPGHELHCGRCGVLAVPGWSGSMQLSRLELRKPGRNRKSKPTEKAGDATKLLWTCHCGWQTIMPGPAPAWKKRFKKRKMSDSVNQNEDSLPVLSPAVEEATVEQRTPIESPPIEQPPWPKAALPLRLFSPTLLPSTPKISEPASIRSVGAPHEAVTPMPDRVPFPAAMSSRSDPASRPADTMDAQANKRIVSEKPTVSEKTQPRKKRGKREGLQAMLAAKKETESKQSSSGGLGLSSFLQGLKGA